ncbi:MAG: hypothetical protein RJA76_1258 [Bacteroidota bacterium]|jgi:hypothetical protein
MKNLHKSTNLFSRNLTWFNAFLLITIISLSSCEEITDLQPSNSFSETTAFTSAARCELSMAGVYDAAQSGFYAGGAVRGYPFGAASTEQGDMRGEDMLNVATFYAITYEGTYNSTTANNQFHWETLYALINRANVVIDGVNGAAAKGVISAEKAKEYEAEARYLRALAHHELLIHFARPFAETADASHPGVPYRTIAVNSPATVDEAKSQGRNTVKVCYDKIIEDLNFAEVNLPSTRPGSLRISRATKGAAIALKSRVYLHANNWAKVVEESAKLVNGSTSFTSPVGSYALTASPDGPFASPGANLSNTESIFSIENASIDNPGVNGALGAMYANSPGRALIAISPIIWNASFWRPTDLRRSLLTVSSGRAYFSTKYKDAATYVDANPIIRYAEVLLNRAEALARQATGVDATALALLNAIRNRAVRTADDQYTASTFATKNELITAILNERRIEFLAEGRRWADIHRLAKDATFSTNGVPSKVAYTSTSFASWNANVPYAGSRAIAAIPYADYRFIWPIPISEINANPVLAKEQNPGY